METGETERALPAGRDMSRAHWQRSVGAVIFGRAADVVYEHAGMIPDELELHKLQGRFDGFQDWDRMESVTWDVAFELATNLFQTNEYNPKELLPTDEKTTAELLRFTDMQRVDLILSEAKRSMRAFPLNLANFVSHEAKSKGVIGLEITDLASIAKILERPDFGQMVNQAMLTRNGMWEIFSDAKYSPNYIFRMTAMIDVEFEDGTVRFTDEFLANLKRQLAQVNQYGLSVGLRSADSTSSGCPAAHLRPHFTSSPEDIERLHELAAYYEVSVDELVRPREQSVVADGIDLLAKRLRDANKLLIERNVWADVIARPTLQSEVNQIQL